MLKQWNQMETERKLLVGCTPKKFGLVKIIVIWKNILLDDDKSSLENVVQFCIRLVTLICLEIKFSNLVSIAC